MDLLELIKSAFLGLVEGVTEWLPISSTGHLILVDEFVKLDVTPQFWNMFEVVIQLGAILAVCVLFFHDLNPFSARKGARGRRQTWVLWGKIIVGCIPAAVIGLAVNDFMEEHLNNSYVVAAALIVYGIAFIIIENRRAARDLGPGCEAVPGRSIREGGTHFASSAEATSICGSDSETGDFGEIATLQDITWKTALGIGLFQVLAIVPGTSRSGSTIIGGLLLGCTRSVAARFTFFLAVPVMFGASLLKLVKYFIKGGSFGASETAIMAVGCIVAFLVSLAAIRWLMDFVRCHDFKGFGVYRIVLGIIVLAYFVGVRPALGL
ncbi:Undecaprenyl-diphosphatase [Coriobacterium glomerans PW2]|uniref:Undecaprenyl-diphosphatase n=1 Tax=Coriobacterium glomerans (strain ATCC 49209 / DSM 20642 / JCM 10262 / PW2) TaxID=700015 RepID=F2NB93_CORGP|nr:undecaprenyl-diphosphate phosphatase [Coriobacterium glomerans]AEB06629.1 Undecaprenyl-diphosphatase [Coriobacterium glomerans PW2]